MTESPGPASPSPPPGTSPRSAGEVVQTAGRGAAALVAVSALGNVVSLISSLVLARALAPTEYGAFAVAATVVGFGRFLGDCGAGSVLIQKPGPAAVDRGDLGRALTIQTAIAAVAACLLIALAPVLRVAFDAPASATWVVSILALTLLIEAPGVVPRTHLRRQQRFQRLQLLSVGALLALYATQIGGLLAGYGLAALVAAQVVGSVVSTLTLVLAGGGLVRPVAQGALALARRGVAYQGTPAVQALFTVLALVVVGTALSTREIGLWAWSTVLATPLITLTAQLHHVAFPSLARLNEHHLDRYDEVVRTVARLQFLFASVAVGVLGGLALPMVRLVFDPRWLEATGAARAALLGVLPLALATLLAAALEARGRPYQRLRSMIMSSAGGLVAALFLAHAFGVTGAAVGVFIVVPLLDVLFLLRAAPVDLRRAIVDGVVLTSVTLGVASLAASRVDSLTDLFAAGSAVGLLGLGLIAVVDPKPVRRAWSLLRRR